MKILLLGHRDIASNVALSLIAGALPAHRFDVRLSGDVAPRVEPPAALRELAAHEGRLCDGLSSNAAARAAGIVPFDELAARSGGNCAELTRPNEPEGLAALAACAPDLVISVRYRRILKAAAIAVPRHGVINLHSGLLPAYKGMMATFWALLEAQATLGCTLHRIVDAGIDTGPVIGRAPLPADPQRTYLANVLSLYPSGCAMVIDAVQRLERGESLPHAAQAGPGHYYSWPAAADVTRFESAGLRLFDDADFPAFLHTL